MCSWCVDEFSLQDLLKVVRIGQLFIIFWAANKSVLYFAFTPWQSTSLIFQSLF